MRIAMPRGDIRLVRFRVNNRRGKPADVDFTEIYFTVKRSAKDRPFIFQKRLSTGGIVKLGTGDYQLKIEPEDTCNMVVNDVSFPHYDFDIQVEYEDSVKETFTGIFVLNSEVTHIENEGGNG